MNEIHNITNQRQVRCLLLLVCICSDEVAMEYTQHHSSCCVLSVFPTKMGDDVNLGDIFFIFFPTEMFSRYVRDSFCIATHAGSEHEWTLYPAGNVCCQLPRTVVSYYSFFRCRRRYCSRTNNLCCTRFCRNKTKISIQHAACWLTPFKCVFIWVAL